MWNLRLTNKTLVQCRFTISHLPCFFRNQCNGAFTQMTLDMHMPGTACDLSFIYSGFEPNDSMASEESIAEIKAEATVAKLTWLGEEVAGAAVRMVCTSKRITIAFRPIVVHESWQNYGMAKRLVTMVHSVVTKGSKGKPVDILVKATSRSWPMWLSMGARITKDAICMASAWQQQDNCKSFLALHEGCIDAIIYAKNLVPLV